MDAKKTGTLFERYTARDDRITPTVTSELGHKRGTREMARLAAEKAKSAENGHLKNIIKKKLQAINLKLPLQPMDEDRLFNRETY